MDKRMTKLAGGTIPKRALAAILLFTSGAFAQLGGGSGATANQLPLSGRTAQNGSVTATESPVPGTTTSVNTINPTLQVSGPYTGSTGSTATLPFSGKLSLREAVQRALQYNLGAVGIAQAIRQARGQQRVARSSLLPNLNGALHVYDEQLDLKAQGLGSIPHLGASLPAVIGPFDYFDLRATLTQTVADMTALDNYRSSREIVRADRYSAEDARDLIVFAVGGAYLQAIAASARVESVRAQLETAEALYSQASQKRGVGLLAQTDVNRSQVQALTQRERLLSLRNDLAKQKINLARMVGLPASDGYVLSEEIPFSPPPAITEEEALKQALVKRADLKAAEAQAQAARLLRSAARAERLPSASVGGDYGLIGTRPAQSNGTFTAVGTLRIPIWQGGRTEGDIEQADAALAQRKAEIEDLRGRIESDIRDAYLDLEAANSQVEVAVQNVRVTRETLALTRQRFDAGVTDNVEVVQAQESVAGAELDYINSVFAHNLAKLSLARAIGGAAENLAQFLKLQ
jgi:outer membrane protein TolC